MFNYALFSTRRSSRRYPQLAIAFMYFFGTLFSESANLLLLCTIGNPQDIIINMIAFMIIAQIQDIYSKSLEHSVLKSKIVDMEFV